jgi:hypothetical protein
MDLRKLTTFELVAGLYQLGDSARDKHGLRWGHTNRFSADSMRSPHRAAMHL